jgi:hypothetical protein
LRELLACPSYTGKKILFRIRASKMRLQKPRHLCELLLCGHCETEVKMGFKFNLALKPESDIFNPK